jgi:hypothetical protein
VAGSDSKKTGIAPGRRLARFAAAMLVGAIMALGGMVLISGSVTALERTEVKRMVIEEALATRVPPSLALALAKVESDFMARALSPSGARGVMQVMPETARVEFGIDPDELWRPRLNIRLGIDMLERLIDRYGGNWELALSHYNGGALTKRDGWFEPHAHTRSYVEAVLRWAERYTDQAMVWGVAEEPMYNGWTPARTQVASAVAIREVAPPHETVTGAIRRTLAAIERHRALDLDDFSHPLDPRRFHALDLDDFGS